MKWIRRLLIVFLCLVALSLVASAFGYRMLRGKPQWYSPRGEDPQSRERAASHVEDEILETRNWSQGAEVARTRATTTPLAADPLELVLTEEEMNAFFAKYEEAYDWRSRYGRFFTDPQIILHDGHIILAATATDLDTVLSVHLSPGVDAHGQIHLDVGGVFGGELPLPRALWQRYGADLDENLSRRLPALEARARLRPDGSANDELVSATLLKMLLHFVRAEPADPVIYLPAAARITRVEIADKSLRVTLTRGSP